MDLSGHERLIERVPGRLYIEDIAKDGRVLVEHDFSRAGIGFRGPADRADRDLSWLDLSLLAALSPDGSQILFSEAGEAAGNRRLVYIRDTAGADAIRLGEGAALGYAPDGKTVLARTEDGQLSLLPTGAGEPRTIAPPGRLYDAAALFPDGRMLCWAQEPGHGARLYLRDTAGAWKAISTEFPDNRGLYQIVLSPSVDRAVARDGDHLLLFTAATSEQRAIGGWPLRGDIAGWTADGQSLYMGRAGGDYIELLRFQLNTGKSEPWKRIDVPRAMPIWARVTPDGRSYAYVYQVTATDAFVVSGLR